MSTSLLAGDGGYRSLFGGKVMFKYCTDNNRHNETSNELGTGCFVGINPMTTEYLIANKSGTCASATVGRMQGNNAYNLMIPQDVTVSNQEYVMEGSRSTPVGVRTHTPSVFNLDPVPSPGFLLPLHSKHRDSFATMTMVWRQVQGIIQEVGSSTRGGFLPCRFAQ